MHLHTLESAKKNDTPRHTHPRHLHEFCVLCMLISIIMTSTARKGLHNRDKYNIKVGKKTKDSTEDNPCATLKDKEGIIVGRGSQRSAC